MKKWIALLLAIAAVWMFAACGNNAKESKTSDTTTSLENGSTEKVASEGLKYTRTTDATGYTVAGIGTCEDKEIVIPSTYNDLPVTDIGYAAFSGCDTLTAITIPDSVTTIGEYAFSDCIKLTSITLPESVTRIGHSSFDKCVNLTSVTILGSLPTIPPTAFNGCRSLTNFVIPDGVTLIGIGAFDNCSSLQSITIPKSMTIIGKGIFLHCDNLKTIYYTGTEEEWKNIDVDEGNEILESVDMVYNYAG